MLVWELILALCEAPHEAEAHVTFDGEIGFPIFDVDSSFGRTDLVFDDDGEFKQDAAELEELKDKLKKFYEKNFPQTVPVAPNTIQARIKEMLENILPELSDDEIPF